MSFGAKKIHNLVYVGLGIILPLLFMLLIDWYDVKIKRIEIHSLWFWAGFILFSIFFIFKGLYRYSHKITLSLLLAILIVAILAVIDMYIMLNFHVSIGGHL